MSDSRYHAELDDVTEPEWSELLGRFEDANLYQTWTYGAVRWGEANLSHLVLYRNGEVAALAQLRILCPRLVSRGVAYLRWGPLCQLRGRDPDPAVLHRMATALHEEYVVKRRLFLRILPNAFAASPRAQLFRIALSRFNRGAATPDNRERTLRLDLTAPLEELRQRLDQKWRNQLNRAEKNGLVLLEGDSAADYQAFAQIYARMRGRKQFGTTVDVEEFARIHEGLPSGCRLKILRCEHQGRPVSAIVCSALGNTGIYLLGASHDGGANTKGAYLLQWTMIRWLKQNGFQYYDLGGIDPENNPGVYHFKRGLSGQDLTRIAPFESCEDWVSVACMKAMDLARGRLGALFQNTAASAVRPPRSEGQGDGPRTRQIPIKER